jgi:LacI family transcriptional regulator
MAHDYPLKEIATQAGVSLATVDRVMHGRDGVTRTMERRVKQALSSGRFRGEEEREIGFRRALRERFPHLEAIEVSEGFGRNRATGLLVQTALEKSLDINAVYSIGGGNAAIVAAFRAARREIRVFIGHDLDADNRKLLRDGTLNAVLHHDLRQDMRIACQHIMRAHGALPKISGFPLSQVQVVTPFNVPSVFGLP